MYDSPVTGVYDGETTGVAGTMLGELSHSARHQDRVGKGSSSDEFEAMCLHAIRSDVHKSYVCESPFSSRK